ncbi:ATP-binding cassette domain-containing protein [Methanosarcina sp. KYL-1]|uniref:ABC transporter ATP-binding protein n=1 Tax=Methanosarcina sp. KYL-1 TaxID=2602068 RepID=UPI0021008B95|nr:ABC transporter ATP-binding protein [Methanosarcina sp. KYL-1]MCQ1535464.1 ATP-binding cassette domain-containing protein [Methanosarcina sp. KYL-1]
MQDDIIRYEDVGISYGSKKVLSGFSLSIPKGWKILLKGKSGTGKSTLFKMLLGFEKPSEGSLYYRERPVDPSIAWEIRREVAYVSQDTDLGQGHVKELLEEIFSYRPNRTKMSREKLHRLMEEFELEEDTLDKNFEDLSGGEKQRVGILIALLLGRDIFLLDEATSALDAELKKKVADYFLQHSEWTLFIISHDREWERDGVRVVELSKNEENEKSRSWTNENSNAEPEKSMSRGMSKGRRI